MALCTCTGGRTHPRPRQQVKQLKDPLLKTIGHFINGARVQGTSLRTSDIFNPATGDVIAELALANDRDLDTAVTASDLLSPENASYAECRLSQFCRQNPTVRLRPQSGSSTRHATRKRRQPRLKRPLSNSPEIRTLLFHTFPRWSQSDVRKQPLGYNVS